MAREGAGGESFLGGPLAHVCQPLALSWIGAKPQDRLRGQVGGVPVLPLVGVWTYTSWVMLMRLCPSRLDSTHHRLHDRETTSV
jgi:hypothetical protein